MSEEQNLYDDSEFYDLVHGRVAAPETIAFYLDKIALYGEPVLELACGTGAYLIPFAENRVEACGIDLSPAMLERARAKARTSDVALDVSSGDIRDFALNRQFPLILLLGNSLQHLTTREEVEKCFACVRRHLTSAGRFIVEVFNPSLKILSRSSEETVLDSVYETEGGRKLLHGRVDYDAASQINRVTWRMTNVETEEIREFKFTMRQFFPQELDALLTCNGFRIEHKYGDRDGSPFESRSPRQIVVAK